MSNYAAGILPGLGTSSAYVLTRREDGETDHYQVLAARHGAPTLSYAEQAIAAAWLIEQQAPNAPWQINLDLTGTGQPVLEVFRTWLADRWTLRGWKLVEDESYERFARPPVVGTLHLLARIVTLTQAGGLHLPHTPDGQRLYQAIGEIRPDTLFPAGEQGALLVALGLALCGGGGGPGMLLLPELFEPEEPGLFERLRRR